MGVTKGSDECFKLLLIHSMKNNKEPKAVNKWLDENRWCCEEFSYEKISMILGMTKHGVITTERTALRKIKKLLLKK